MLSCNAFCREIVLTGCEDGWESLFNSHYERVYKTAYSILKDNEASRDIVQESFIRAFTKFHQLDDKKKFGAWVCKIAKNMCLDMLRKKAGIKGKIISLYDEEGKFRDSIIQIADFSMPEEILERRETLRLVLKCIDSLDKTDRRIAYLRFYEDMSYAQVAESMNLKESTVKIKIFRLRRRIAYKLEVVQSACGKF